MGPTVDNPLPATDDTLVSFLTNLALFAVLLLFFEIVRHVRPIYLGRSTRLFQKACTESQYPSTSPFSWIFTTMGTSDESVLKLVGLDGYVLLRYIKLCMRMGMFFSGCGCLIMAPIYGHYPNKNVVGWNKYTLANVPMSEEYSQWVPVVFCYIFSTFYCQILYHEYKNFVNKRVQYLIQGDLDTPSQTYYTVLVERIPSEVKSLPKLREFFERIFPGNIYCGKRWKQLEPRSG
jgi:hypothetical protein